MLPDPRNLLSRPGLYSFFENSVGARAFRKRFCAEWIGDSSKDRVLDLGCGTAEILEFLAFKEYVGLDENLRYIEHARKRHAGARFEPLEVLSADLSPLGSFDLALGLGFFHHLPDEGFKSVLQKVRKLLKPGARFLSFDPCFHEGQSFLSRRLVSMDRGRFVRRWERYAEIAESVFPEVRAMLWRGALRIPYSHCILEMK